MTGFTPRWMVLLVALACGGCFCHTAASTVLTFGGEGAARGPWTMGFDKVIWARMGEGMGEAAGRGWHPREHESYCFFWMEPNPGFGLRLLHLVPEGDHRVRLEVMIDRTLLREEAGAPERYLVLRSEKPLGWRSVGERFYCDVERVVLAAEDGRTVEVNGRIAARLAEVEEVRGMWQEQQRAMAVISVQLRDLRMTIREMQEEQKVGYGAFEVLKGNPQVEVKIERVGEAACRVEVRDNVTGEVSSGIVAEGGYVTFGGFGAHGLELKTLTAQEAVLVRRWAERGE